MKTGLLLALLLLLSVLGVVQPAYAQKDSLVIITPYTKFMMDTITPDLQAWYKSKFGRDLDVSFIIAGSPVAFARIVEWEGSPDADIFWGGEVDLYVQLVEKGLLTPYEVKEQIPDSFEGQKLRDPNNNWVTANFWGSGFIWNNERLRRLNAEPPRTFDDLIESVFANELSMTTPARSSTLHVTVEMTLQSMGEDDAWALWRRLAVNVPAFAGRSIEAYEAVTRGELAVGVAIPDVLAVLALKEGFDIGFTYPSPTSFVIAPTALLKGAKNEGAGKAFIDWILTREGQISSIKAGLIPVRDDVKLRDVPVDQGKQISAFLGGVDTIYQTPLQTFSLDAALSAQRFEQVNSIFDDTIVKVLDTLKSAWQTIADTDAFLSQARQEVASLEQQGMDVTQPNAKLAEAQAKLDAATDAFDKGEYDQASTLATEARTLASGAAGLAVEKPQPPYALYAGVVLAILLIIAVAVYIRKRKSGT